MEKPNDKDIKAIYLENGIYVVRNFTDGSVKKLTKNKEYAKEYSQLYSIQIRY